MQLENENKLQTINNVKNSVEMMEKHNSFLLLCNWSAAVPCLNPLQTGYFNLIVIQLMLRLSVIDAHTVQISNYCPSSFVQFATG